MHGHNVVVVVVVVVMFKFFSLGGDVHFYECLLVLTCNLQSLRLTRLLASVGWCCGEIIVIV